MHNCESALLYGMAITASSASTAALIGAEECEELESYHLVFRSSRASDDLGPLRRGLHLPGPGCEASPSVSLGAGANLRDEKWIEH